MQQHTFAHMCMHTQVSVTAESSEFLSNQLAALPSTLLSVQELNTVLELAGELLNISGTNTQVQSCIAIGMG